MIENKIKRYSQVQSSHFPLMEAEVSAETLGLLQKFYEHFYIF